MASNGSQSESWGHQQPTLHAVYTMGVPEACR